MLIDIHAHINNDMLLKETEDILARAKSVGIGKIVCVGCDYNTSLSAIDLANKYENVYAAVGVHPNHCFELDEKIEELILSAKDNKKIVAIGEIGLDYYDLDYQIKKAESANANIIGISKDDFIKKQKEVFLRQINLAKSISLPIMIHMRDSASDTLKLLESNKDLIKNGGLFHCYSGSVETARRIFDLGFYISIGGAITFKNSRNMPEVLKEIGIDRVTLETDTPFLSPEPYRGKRNEPKNIIIIAEKIADILDIDLKEVEEKTTSNCYKVFNRLK